MELFVIRHGQTDGNLNDLMDGIRDIDLNQTGIAQAESTKELLSGLEFDLVICSPLKRARHTLDILNLKNCDVMFNDEIIERDCGEFMGRSVYSLKKGQYWNYYDETKYERVEPIKEFVSRIYNFLEDLKALDKQRILIVTHFGVTKAIHCYFNGVPSDGNLQDVGLKNCEVKKYILK